MTHLVTVYKDSGKRGIGNVGSTCYVNTAVQCLAHNLSFLHYILTHEQKGLTQELKAIYEINWIRNHGVVPRKFIKVLRETFSGMIDVHQQNDIQEFLALFVDKLNVAIGTPPVVQPLSPTHGDKTAFVRFQELAEHAWVRSHSHAYSALVDLLYGQCVNQITCAHCGDISHVFDTFATLLISFHESEDGGTPTTDSIGKMLSSYMKNEHIAERECDHCHTKCTGIRVHRFSKLPQVLMISIKRFDSKMRKITKTVMVPEELDMSGACIELNDQNTSSTQYKLMSIACHAGGMGYGHYYAICRHPDERWYIYDDEQVSAMEDYRQANSSHFYTLFYERMSN